MLPEETLDHLLRERVRESDWPGPARGEQLTFIAPIVGIYLDMMPVMTTCRLRAAWQEVMAEGPYTGKDKAHLQGRIIDSVKPSAAMPYFEQYGVDHAQLTKACEEALGVVSQKGDLSFLDELPRLDARPTRFASTVIYFKDNAAAYDHLANKADTTGNRVKVTVDF